MSGCPIASLECIEHLLSKEGLGLQDPQDIDSAELYEVLGDLGFSGLDRVKARKLVKTAKVDTVGCAIQSNEKEMNKTANKNCMQVAADHGATVASRNEGLKVMAEASQFKRLEVELEKCMFSTSLTREVRKRTRSDKLSV